MKKHLGIDIPENLAEIVDPRRTCLVVWDVQVGLAGSVFDKDQYLGRLGAFITALRPKMPVVYTQITPLPRQVQSGWNLYSMMRRFRVDDPAKLPVFMAPGSPERGFPPETAPQDGDIVLEKASPDLFMGTTFEMMMRNRGVTTILFTGIATDVGVETSARAAGARGFFPVVVREGVSSMDKEAHERSLLSLSRQAIVAGMDEILAALK